MDGSVSAPSRLAYCNQQGDYAIKEMYTMISTIGAVLYATRITRKLLQVMEATHIKWGMNWVRPWLYMQVSKGDTVVMMNTGKEYTLDEIGVLAPGKTQVRRYKRTRNQVHTVMEQNSISNFDVNRFLHMCMPGKLVVWKLGHAVRHGLVQHSSGCVEQWLIYSDTKAGGCLKEKQFYFNTLWFRCGKMAKLSNISSL
jgi:hypothetical protein